MRGDQLGFGQDLLDRHLEGRAAGRRRARAAGAFAEEDLLSVALHVVHVARIDAEAVADELLEDGFVALPLGDRAGEERQPARAVEADLGALETRSRGALDGVGHAEPAQLAALA